MGLSTTWEREVLNNVFLQPFADFLLQIRCGVKNGILLHRLIRASTPIRTLDPKTWQDRAQ